MQTNTLTSPRTLELTDGRFYMYAAAFVAGNVLVPYLVHIWFGMQAGMMFLPIYFFSLMAGLKYGWKAGVVVGLFSGIVSYALTGMPPLEVLGSVVAKGMLIGLASGVLLEKSKIRQPFVVAFLAIVVAQALGLLYMLAIGNPSPMALSDLQVGYPGLILQLVLVPFIVMIWTNAEGKHADQAA